GGSEDKRFPVPCPGRRSTSVEQAFKRRAAAARRMLQLPADREARIGVVAAVDAASYRRGQMPAELGVFGGDLLDRPAERTRHVQAGALARRSRAAGSPAQAAGPPEPPRQGLPPRPPARRPPP